MRNEDSHEDSRNELFEKRKQEHIDRGYRFEDEQPIPVNGFCAFIAVREPPVSNTLAELSAHVSQGSQPISKFFADQQTSRLPAFR